MTRLDRIIKAFDDYDNFVKNNTLAGFFECGEIKSNTVYEQKEDLDRIRNDVSVLIQELKEHGCRRKF